MTSLKELPNKKTPAPQNPQEAVQTMLSESEYIASLKIHHPDWLWKQTTSLIPYVTTQGKKGGNGKRCAPTSSTPGLLKH